MSMRYQAAILTASYFPLKAPSAPTIGAATVASGTSVSVTFTAPTDIGGGAISSYTVVSSPGNIIASGSSSPVVVTGLTTDTAYSFRVFANNAYGNSPASASSNVVTPAIVGQQAYTTPGTYSWVAPAGVTSVSVVAVGAGAGAGAYGGGGGGGALAYKNNITVVPGNSYTVVVGAGSAVADPGTAAQGGNSSFAAGFGTMTAGGGFGGSTTGSPSYGGAGGAGGTRSGTFDGGGSGGSGGTSQPRTSGNWNMAGGGGAGGYAGNGGNGGDSSPSSVSPGTAGSGGGGGGGGGGRDTTNSGYGYGGGGGGVGLLGQGANGTAGVARTSTSDPGPGQQGGGGSGGGNGSNSFAGYGNNIDGTVSATSSGGQCGGGGGNAYRAGGNGGVRIIWGSGRAFPSTNTGDL